MKTLLDAVKAAGPGDAIKLVTPQADHGVEVLFGGAGTITSVIVELEGSISGSSYASIGSGTYTGTTDGIFFAVDKMVGFVRANITTYSSGTKATGTLTSTGVTPSSGDTVLIDTKTYTFQTASLATEGFVLIGVDYAEAIDHLIDAINYTGNPGVDYSCAAAHSSVTATLASACSRAVTLASYILSACSYLALTCLSVSSACSLLHKRQIMCFPPSSVYAY